MWRIKSYDFTVVVHLSMNAELLERWMACVQSFVLEFLGEFKNFTGLLLFH